MPFKKPWGRLSRLILSCPVALLLIAHPLQAEEPLSVADREMKHKAPAAEYESKGTVGWAVYYKKHYHGKTTHSGVIYNQRAMTAAHASLPHGSRVRVTNIANKRSVVVTITDRCRKRNGEWIDLSRTAARELGFLGRGKARVRIIPLE